MAPTKQIARDIFRRTLASIDIPAAMERKLLLDGTRLILPNGTVEFAHASRIVLIAIGKAAHAMVNGLRALMPGGASFSGVVSAPTEPAVRISGIEYFVAGHPIPNQESLQAAEAILRALRACDERTLVFFLLSGGGSALVELPLEASMTLPDVGAVNQALVTSGASIEQINTVRRHISAVKGGRLALAAGAAQKITLAVTDVPVGREAALASGPTLPDPTTVADVQGILAKYDLWRRFPPPLRRWIEAGAMPETPKPSDPAFKSAHFLLLLGMDDLFHAAHQVTEAHGYFCCCDNSTDEWPVERAADSLLGQLDSLQHENPRRRVAMIADGELSSPVHGSGIGGRNSAFVLACVEKIAGSRITVLSAGTDGIDGNSPAAGAVADGETLACAQSLGLDCAAAFRSSDAYSFFERLDDAVITGPTGNNLRDLRILLSEP